MIVVLVIGILLAVGIPTRSNGTRFETRTQSGGCASVGGATAALSASAADATLGGNFELDSDGFVGTPAGSGWQAEPGAGGTAVFTFTVAETGNYRLIGTVLGPTSGSDSFWIRTSLDGFSRVILWDLNAPAVRTDYVNDRNTGSQDVLFGIPAGTTLTVEVSQREAGAKISTLDLVPS